MCVRAYSTCVLEGGRKGGGGRGQIEYRGVGVEGGGVISLLIKCAEDCKGLKLDIK